MKTEETQQQQQSSRVALELAPYIKTPAHKIPGYAQKIVALVTEWVDDSNEYLIPFYDDIGGSYAPPQNKLDTLGIFLAKRDLFDLMNNPSQRRIEDGREFYVDSVNVLRNVYVTWFYEEERIREVAACFNFLVQPSSHDSDTDKRRKLNLIKMHKQVAIMTKKRGDKWVDDIDAFVKYWSK